MAIPLPCPMAIAAGKACGVCKWCLLLDKRGGLDDSARAVIADITEQVRRHLNEQQTVEELRLHADEPQRTLFEQAAGAEKLPGAHVTEIDLN